MTRSNKKGPIMSYAQVEHPRRASLSVLVSQNFQTSCKTSFGRDGPVGSCILVANPLAVAACFDCPNGMLEDTFELTRFLFLAEDTFDAKVEAATATDVNGYPNSNWKSGEEQIRILSSKLQGE